MDAIRIRVDLHSHYYLVPPSQPGDEGRVREGDCLDPSLEASADMP